MTNVSGETKKSMTGLINITGILSYPVEQTFCRSLKHCSTSHAKQFAVGIHYFCLEKTR